LRKAWDFKSGKLPSEAQLQDLLARIGWEKLDWQRPWLAFTVPGMELDFGGIGKEYAADRAATLCYEQGFCHGLVDLGGDIKVIGPPADGTAWQVGIQHPRQAESLLVALEVKHGAVASSGDYERCIVIKGRRYSHLLNPKTGWPTQGLVAVSVIAPQCLVAGSATTIAMLQEDAGKAWLENLGLPHVWMDAEGRIGGTIIA
jgi:thiamine biosynthesis lipoprotein